MEVNSKVLRNSLNLVEKQLTNSLEKIFGIKGKVTAQKYNKSEDFDFQSPYSLMHFKNIEKNFNEKKFSNKEELTDFIKEKLEENYKDTFKKVDTFQNLILLQLNDKFLSDEINTVLKHGIVLEQIKPKEKVVVDFSSPNIAKEMHVGHLRSTIMGESICRVLEFLGDDVERVNHLGDWGTQFGMLILYLQETYPDYKTNMPDVSDLTKFYKASRAKFDSDPDFKKRAQEKVVELQRGNQDCLDAWKTLCDVSMSYFNVIYKRLDITLKEYGESFYNSMIPEVLKELDEKKLTKLDQGAVCMFVKKKKQPLMLVKSDGGYNYDSTDMAAAWFRLNKWKANRIIYLTDIGQSHHFQTLFEAVQMAGWQDKKTKLEHMCFGIVCGNDSKRLKTRDGETVKLSMLLDEAKDQAKKQIEERIKEEGKSQLAQDEIDQVAEALGIACVKYFDMRQNRIQDYKFDMDAMTSQKGDTAVYLMYSYIRICSILRKSGISEEELKKQDFEFSDDYEKVLAKHIVNFVDMINYVQENLALNFICNYLYQLAKKVASGYKKYQILGNDNTLHRLQLIYVIKLVMEQCFFLLGIKTIDKI